MDDVRLMGHCHICTKQIESLPGMKNNPDGAVSVSKYNYTNALRIYGNYGSKFDMCMGKFDDFVLFNQLNNIFHEHYICDECFSKLLKENKVTLYENEFWTPYLPEKNNAGEMDNNNFVKPVIRGCCAVRYDDPNLLKKLNTYVDFRLLYKAEISKAYPGIVNILKRTEDDKWLQFDSMQHGDVIVLYGSGIDFEIITEDVFRKRFEFRA